MAYAKKTLADLKQSLADRHDSGELPTDSTTLAFWTRLLNRGQAYCADRLKLTKSTSLTTSSGTIALPDDFISASRVYTDDGAEMTQVSQNEKEYYEYDLVYWITGDHDSGFSLNTNDDDTYTVYYAFRPSEMSSNSDECIIPDPEAVVAFAYSMLRRSETDPIGDADKAMEECDTRLAELQSDYLTNSAFSGITLSQNA